MKKETLMTRILLLNPFTNLTKEVIIRHASERRLWKALGYIFVMEEKVNA